MSINMNVSESSMTVNVGAASNFPPNITAEASVDNTTGTPDVTVTKSGTLTSPHFTFTFTGIKGETGDQGETGADAEIAVGTITLTTSWTSVGTDLYSQTVTIPDITENSKIDLQPDSAVIAQMASDGVSALWVVNNAGVATAYAYGAAPTVSMTVQYSRMEVTA